MVGVRGKQASKRGKMTDSSLHRKGPGDIFSEQKEDELSTNQATSTVIYIKKRWMKGEKDDNLRLKQYFFH